MLLSRVYSRFACGEWRRGELNQNSQDDDFTNENTGEFEFSYDHISERETQSALLIVLGVLQRKKREILRIDPKEHQKASLDAEYRDIESAKRVIGRLLSPANSNEYNA